MLEKARLPRPNSSWVVEVVSNITFLQARSQGFEKGGGLFWKLEPTVNERDPCFRQS